MTSHTIEGHENAHLLLFDAANDGEKLISDLTTWIQQKYQLKKERTHAFCCLTTEHHNEAHPDDELIEKIFLDCVGGESNRIFTAKLQATASPRSHSQLTHSDNSTHLNVLEWFKPRVDRDVLLMCRVRSPTKLAQRLEDNGLVRASHKSLKPNSNLALRPSIEHDAPLALSPHHTHTSSHSLSPPKNLLTSSSTEEPLSTTSQNSTTSPSKSTNPSTHLSPHSPRAHTKPSLSPRCSDHELGKWNKLSLSKSSPKLQSLNLKKRPRMPVEDSPTDTITGAEPLPLKRAQLQPINRKSKKRRVKASPSPERKMVKSNSISKGSHGIGLSGGSNSGSTFRLPPLSSRSSGGTEKLDSM